MKILVNEGLAQSGIDIMESNGFEVITVKVAQNQLQNFINEEQIDGIIIKNNTQIQQELIDACPSLKLIASTSTSMDTVDVQYAIDQGLRIINTQEGSVNAVAELVFAHLLGMVRCLHQSNREMPLEGDINFKLLQKQFIGYELRGKTLGVIGMNPPAIATAKVALGLGMNVLLTDPEIEETSLELEFFDGQTVHFNFTATPLDELLETADFISIHLDSYHNFKLSDNEFKKMKQGVGIVNCTKGGLLDEVALVEAIDKGIIKFAALDAFENEPKPEIQLLMNPKLSLSPRIGTATYEAAEKVSIELANQITTSLS